MSKRGVPFLGPLIAPGRLPLLFVIAVFVLSLLASAVYDLTKDWLNTPLTIAILSLVAIVLVLIGNQVWLRYFRPTLESSPITQPRRGLLVLVSPCREDKCDELAALEAIRYHYRGELDEREKPTLTHCWLVTSPEPDESDEPPAEQTEVDGSKPKSISAWENAQRLKRQFRSQNGHQVEMNVVQVDPNDAEDVYEKVTDALREADRLGLGGQEIIADITGGTKPMTAGMTMAAVAKGREMQYMVARQHDAKGYAVPGKGSYPVLLDLRYVLDADPAN